MDCIILMSGYRDWDPKHKTHKQAGQEEKASVNES